MEAVVKSGTAIIMRRRVSVLAMLFAFLAVSVTAVQPPLAYAFDDLGELDDGDPDGTGTKWRECVDKAFAEYNECLMEGSGWFHRKICDLAFELDVAACSAKALGDIRKAWNGGGTV